MAMGQPALLAQTDAGNIHSSPFIQREPAAHRRTGNLPQCDGVTYGLQDRLRMHVFTRSQRRRQLWPRWMVAWLGAAALGVANGSVRTIVYERRIGSTAAHYVSTTTLLMLLTGYMRWLLRKWPLASNAEALRVGGAWTLLTIAFEFGFGHFVARESWSALSEQYNIGRAKVWILVPAWMAIGPALLRPRR
jgi:hypothetical protein